MRYRWFLASMAGLLFVSCPLTAGNLTINLGPEQIVQACIPPIDLCVEGYSVPSYLSLIHI